MGAIVSDRTDERPRSTAGPSGERGRWEGRKEPLAEDGERPDMQRAVARDVRRHVRRETSGATFWRSLSLLGTVGWSIALPVAGGALAGWILDRRYGTGALCTLLLLSAGVAAGAFLAWNAIRRSHEG
jgi:predicted F0F1-ATPase subunit